MAKALQQWVLFEYAGGKIEFLSKPFRTKQHAEKARLQYPERQRKRIGLGLLRVYPSA
jgi:hypothetical protein